VSEAKDKAKAIRELSIEARLAADLYRRLEPGEVATYSALAEAIGRDPQEGRGYKRCTTARRIVLNEGIVIEAVAGVGHKRLTDAEKAGCGPKVVKKINRAAKRGRKVLTAVDDINGLSSEAKHNYSVSLSQVAVALELTSGQAAKKISRQLADGASALPTRKVLDLF